MNTNSFVAFVIGLLLILNGCISDFNAALPSDNTAILIVEGDLTENTEADFYLSKSIPVSEKYIAEQCHITSARLFIIGSNGYKSSPATNLNNGYYRIFVETMEKNVAYGVQIEYEGDTYTSALSTPVYTPEVEVSWTQPVKEGDVHINVSTHDEKNIAKYFRWHYEEIWEFHAENITTVFFNPGSQTYYEDGSMSRYYCWKKNTPKNILLGSNESLVQGSAMSKKLYHHAASDERFSLLYSVTVTQQAISKPAYEYYLNKQTLLEDMGGLFTPQPSDNYGNIVCQTDPSKKAIGYVEVSKNISKKRHFIYAEEISKPTVKSNCNVMTMSEVYEYLASSEISISEFYNGGYRPIGMDNLEGWISGRCVDCILKGGTKNKPDYWPNNHQ